MPGTRIPDPSTRPVRRTHPTGLPPGLALCVALAAGALTSAAPAPAAAQSGVAAIGTYGSTWYDLEGVDVEEIWSVRVRIGFGALALEPSVAFSDYAPDGGEEVALIIPELQFQLGYPFGRVRPYAGAGLGFVLTDPSDPDVESTTDFDINSAVGVDLALTRSIGLTGEVRVRGIDSFDWTMTDLAAGLVIAF